MIDVVGNDQEDIHGATNPDALKWKSMDKLEK
jgi:hypothetical protein